jgi:hypothetical protein
MYISTSKGFGALAQLPAPLGTLACVEARVNQILSSPSATKRWGVKGQLLPADVQIRHPGAGAANRFRSPSPGGFGRSGVGKSNVFALDIAWRCGFRAPLLNVGGQAHPDFVYPLSNMLTTYAETALQGDVIFNGQIFPPGTLLGKDGTQWGVALSLPEINLIKNDIQALGSRMYILVGWRQSGVGHVGIIRRILNWDGSGTSMRLTGIEYEGWEATTELARVSRWRWQTINCGLGPATGQCSPDPLGSRSLRNFCAIHIIGLLPAAPLSSLPTAPPSLRGVVVDRTDPCRLFAAPMPA